MPTGFCVIGAGNSGHAMAADLALRGHEVRLWNRDAAKAEQLRVLGGIRCTGVIEGFARLADVTCDMGQCLSASQIVLVTVPAFGHADVARTVAPHIRDEHILVLNPGRTFGAMEVRNIIRSHRPDCHAIIAETQTILYTCRMTELGHVTVYALKPEVGLAALPGAATEDLAERLDEFFPALSSCGSTANTGFNNMGAILHPVPTLMNVGWIESPRTAFRYYYEGITPTVASVLELLDEERMAVGTAYGADTQSLKHWLETTYAVQGESLYDCLQANEAYAYIDAPTSTRHRYILEDVPTGLVPIASFGEIAGVPTPCTDIMIDLASKVFRCDFRASGRTAASLGLAGASVDDVVRGLG